MRRSGPLSGIKVIELAGLGPGPFAGMVLSDFGAEVVVVERIGLGGGRRNVLRRGRRSIAVDLKNPDGVDAVLELVEAADVLIEGFRPGVAERLGLGPEICLERNRRLIYGRMTGWGQDGPLAHAAGHDINYVALTGVLNAIGPADRPPVFPMNLLGDFGGGGMLLALGVCAALVERGISGEGQIVDAAMVDGAALLASMIYPMVGQGWTEERESNFLDGGSHFYNTYETKDHKYVAVGAIEPQFYAELMKRIGLESEDFSQQMDRGRWAELRKKLAGVFKTKTRDEWAEVLEGSDACFAPVMSWTEAKDHPHNAARGTLVEVEGVLQPAPAPRFSRTPAAIANPPPEGGKDTEEVLADWGFDRSEIAKLREAGAIG